MQTFYLVRHGDKSPGNGDPKLSAKGKIQAACTARFLMQFPIDIIIASPLLRTRETAAIIAETLHLPINIDQNLRERANWGDVPGQSYEEFCMHWNKATRDRHYTPPGGDSADQTGKRVKATLDSREFEPFSHIAVISHGGAIKDFLWYTFSSAQLRDAHPDFVLRLEQFLRGELDLPPEGDVTECSVTIIEKSKETYRIAKIAYRNHISHL